MTSINQIRSISQLLQYFKAHDKNNDGEIDIEKEAPAADKEQLKKFDKDYFLFGDGAISQKELLKAMQKQLNIEYFQIDSILQSKRIIAKIKNSTDLSREGAFFYKNPELLYPGDLSVAAKAQSSNFWIGRDAWIHALLHDENENVRIYAILGLRNFSLFPESRDAIEAALNDPSDKIKILALTAEVAKVGDYSVSPIRTAVVAPTLIKLLKSNISEIKINTLRLLKNAVNDAKIESSARINGKMVPEAKFEFGGTEFVPEITRILLTDKDAKVRQAAAKTLDGVISVKAGESLTLALRDPDETVRNLAIRALKNLKYENTVEALNEIVKKDDSVFNRKEAFDALKAINSAKAHNALFGALKNSNDEIRWKAIEFAREQKDPKTIPWVKEAMGRTSLKKK